ncbi:MAG: hypothetical protein GQF41_0726 [Candidatus Rifleibacterium amylolyticum]|nr:MAG: hypothetical protein GQF41_0726 [Candidatus Rifleibacterium amylolyticum]
MNELLYSSAVKHSADRQSVFQIFQAPGFSESIAAPGNILHHIHF